MTHPKSRHPATEPRPFLVPILTGGTVALALGDGRLDPEGPGSSHRKHRQHHPRAAVRAS